MNTPKSPVGIPMPNSKILWCRFFAALNKEYLIHTFLSQSHDESVSKSRFKLKSFTFLNSFVFALFLLLSFKSSAQSFTPVTTTINSGIQGYWEYLPADYQTSTEKYPLFIFLHGIGECGNGSRSALDKVLVNGTPNYISKGALPSSFTVNGKKFSFIMIFPQLNDNIRNPQIVSTLIDYLVSKYKVDESRIYLTGLSMGGGLAECYAGENLKFAKRIAGLVDVCGNTYPYPGLTNVIAGGNIPSWFTQSSGDPVVDPTYSPKWVSALNSYSPAMNPKALLNMFSTNDHDAWTQTYDPNWRPNGLNVYEWMLQYYRKSDGSIAVTTGEPSKPTAQPVAKITGSTSLLWPLNNTTLNAGQSSSANGKISSYRWKVKPGLLPFKVSDTTASSITISGLLAGTYGVELTVQDEVGMSAAANTNVVVTPSSLATPVAKISGTTNITLPTNSTVLSADGSSSGNGSISSYQWSYVSGPSTYTLSNATAASLTVSNLVEGSYTFKVTVKDNKDQTASTSVNVVVNPASLATPSAKITGNLSITLPSNSTTLSAASSSSDNGAISSYSWQMVSSTASYTLGSTSSSSLSVSNLAAGNYTLQVTVKDAKNVSASTTATLVVSPAPSSGNPSEDCGCDVTLKANADGGIYASGTGLGVKPGDKVCIKTGKYPYMFLYNFNGTQDKPITLVNCGGQVVVSGDTYGIVISKSSFFKFSGTGTSGLTYGFKVDGTGKKMYVGTGISSSTDFEFDHTEITNIVNGAGVIFRTNPSCDQFTWASSLTMKNVDIHDLNINTTKYEGITAGYAAKSVVVSCNGSTINVTPQLINNLKIHNCTISNTGWDGIETDCIPVNCQIYDNNVTNFGTSNAAGQQAGILFGSSCVGNVYNNYIDKGTGNGILVNGEGGVLVYNNVVANAGLNNGKGLDGILVDGKPVLTTTAKLAVTVANNTIVGSGRDNFRIQNTVGATGTVSNYNNLSIAPKSLGQYSSLDLSYSNTNGIANSSSNNLSIATLANAYLTAPASGDYSLTAKSPAINAGKDLSSLGIKYDKRYVARPQAGVFDIGAFEYGSGTIATPVANITGILDITLPVNITTLSAASSTSNNGAITAYSWKYVSGPTTYTLGVSNTSTLAITNLVAGTYVFQVTVTDVKGQTATSNATVVVNALALATPVAKITGTLDLTLPANSTTLSAAGSTSGNGAISTYSWKYVSGPTTYALGATNASTLAVSNLVAGTYVFQVTVTDVKGKTASSTASVDVNPSVLVVPTAKISGTLVLTLPTSSTTLSAASSTSGNGAISTYSWKYVSGPSTYTLGATNGSTLAVSNLVAGSYVFQVTVTDVKGQSANTTATVTVNKAGSTSDCGCSITLTPNSDGGIYTSGTAIGAKPGDKVCIKAGKYSYIFLYNFNGTADKPITITNCGGQVISSSDNYGFGFTKDSYFKFVGTGDANTKYGFKVDGAGKSMSVGLAASLSTDFEFSNIEITNITSGVGVNCKTNPGCDPATWENASVMKNVDMHDMSISNTHGEGFYVGFASKSSIVTCDGVTKEVFPQKINNLKIHNCQTLNTGWDGIQVASTPVNCLIYDNIVKNFGTENMQSQQAGILFGGNCNGKVYNNYVEKGTGSGLQIFGEGKVYAYNNVIVNTGNDGGTGQDGIFIDGRPVSATSPQLSVYVANNTIVGSGRDNIRIINSLTSVGSDNYFYNNLSVAPKSYGAYSYDLNRSFLDVEAGIGYTQSNNLFVINQADAYFTDPTSGNYAVTAKSGAINKGKDVSSVGITFDKNYLARPQGGAFDIGAYEFNSSTAARVLTGTQSGTALSATNDAKLSLDNIKAGSVETKLSLFPVPAKDVLNVLLSGESKGKVTIRVTDYQGRVLLEKANLPKDFSQLQHVLNISQLKSGSYILTTVVDNKLLTGRFIKIN